MKSLDNVTWPNLQSDLLLRLLICLRIGFFEYYQDRVSAISLKIVKAITVLVFVQSCSDTMLGSARDSNGCISSAGYSWCQSMAECIRPWELAEEKKFGNTPKDLKNFCN